MSNLNAAVQSALSGLNAQGSSIAIISQNISNANTTAYKSSSTDFESLVTGSGATASGVVTSSNSANLESQGSITSTGTATNLAIQGSGFFVVTNSATNLSTSGNDNFTRNGDFSTDKLGYLVNNEGEYLLGYATDSQGHIPSTVGANDVNSLKQVYVNAAQGSAKATSTIGLGANLPASAATGAVFTTSMTIYDTQGASSTINQTWTKTAADTWTLGISDPVNTSDSTVTTGTISPNLYNISFNNDGTIASVTDPSGATTPTTTGDLTAPTTITWTNGSGGNGTGLGTITLNFGTLGRSDELTQFTSATSIPGVAVSNYAQDGVPYGTLSSLTVGSTGLVTAEFNNGLKQPVYQLALGTFSNANGLTLVGGTIYSASATSGLINLENPGTAAAGKIESSALEASNADTTASLSNLVTAQQAYNAAAKVIGTVSSMYTSLLQAIQ